MRLLVLLFVECGFLLHVPLWQCTYVCSKVKNSQRLGLDTNAVVSVYGGGRWTEMMRVER